MPCRDTPLQLRSPPYGGSRRLLGASGILFRYAQLELQNGLGTAVKLEELVQILTATGAELRARRQDGSGEPVLNLLAEAGGHLDAARFGARLYAFPHSEVHDDRLLFSQLREDHVTLENAARNLTFRGVVSAFDLCAAALARMFIGPPTGSKERSVAFWTPLTKRDKIAIPEYRDWLESTLNHRDWIIVSSLRHALTHRIVPRHVVIGATPPSRAYRTAVTRIHAAGEVEDLGELLPRAVAFGTDGWRRFVDLLRLW